jgi:hypothetical protein
MRFTHLRTGSTWQDSLQAYDYMRSLAKADWAWECLRRNLSYRSMARLHRQRGVTGVRLTAGPFLTRLRARQPHAEAWGLCCFCRPIVGRRPGPPSLVV